MKVPTNKLYLKMEWQLFVMKFGFYIMHIISRSILFIQNVFQDKNVFVR